MCAWLWKGYREVWLDIFSSWNADLMAFPRLNAQYRKRYAWVTGSAARPSAYVSCDVVSVHSTRPTRNARHRFIKNNTQLFLICSPSSGSQMKHSQMWVLFCYLLAILGPERNSDISLKVIVCYANWLWKGYRAVELDIFSSCNADLTVFPRLNAQYRKRYTWCHRFESLEVHQRFYGFLFC